MGVTAAAFCFQKMMLWTHDSTWAWRKLLRLYLKKRSRRMVAVLACAMARLRGGWEVARSVASSLTRASLGEGG